MNNKIIIENNMRQYKIILTSMGQRPPFGHEQSSWMDASGMGQRPMDASGKDSIMGQRPMDASGKDSTAMGVNGGTPPCLGVNGGTPPCLIMKKTLKVDRVI